MKKRQKKVFVGSFLIGFIILVAYHLNYEENKRNYDYSYINEIRLYNFRDYITESNFLSMHNEGEINYISNPNINRISNENEYINPTENSAIFMGNYSNKLQTASWLSISNFSDLSVDSVIKNGSRSNENLINMKGVSEVINNTKSRKNNTPEMLKRLIIEENRLFKYIPERNKIMKEFKRRQHVIEQVCKRFNVQKDSTIVNKTSTNKSGDPMVQESFIETVSTANFHIVRSASTMTCFINKAASTSLAVSLLKADGRPIPEWNQNLSPHNAVAALRPQTEAEFNFARKYFFKFLLVRHPFERLLSAYRDKVERADHWSLRMFRQHILNTLRNTAPFLPTLKVERTDSRSTPEERDQYPTTQYPSTQYPSTQYPSTDAILNEENPWLSIHRQNHSYTEESSHKTQDQLPSVTLEQMQNHIDYIHVLPHANNIHKSQSEKGNNTFKVETLDSIRKDSSSLENFTGERVISKYNLLNILQKHDLPKGKEFNLIENGRNEDKASIENINTEEIVKRTETQQNKNYKSYDVNEREQLFSSAKLQLANNDKSDKSQHKDIPSDDSQDKDIPSFSDFLEYILKTNLTADGDFGSHWATYWERCLPCTINYDVIAKLEMADRDLMVVYERLGIPWMNVQKWYNRSVTSASSKRDMLEHYYSQLNPSLIGRVYRRFALDFLLFEYDIMQVFRLAGHCRTSNCKEMALLL